MLEAHPCVEVGDYDPGAARGRIPGSHGIDGTGRRGGARLQVPLLREQRIVGSGVRIAPLIDLRVLDLRIRPQPLERCRDWLTGNRRLHTNDVQKIGNRAGCAQRRARACHQSGDTILRRSDLRACCGVACGAKFDDDRIARGCGAAMRVRAHRVEFAIHAGGAGPECDRHQHRPG